MKTLDLDVLAAITGGTKKFTPRPEHVENPAHLSMSGGCPRVSNANRAKADAWVGSHRLRAKDVGGWNDPIYGNMRGIYTYEHFNRMHCAPGEEF